METIIAFNHSILFIANVYYIYNYIYNYIYDIILFIKYYQTIMLLSSINYIPYKIK